MGAPPINKVIYNILSNSYLIKELQQFGDNCQFIWQTGSDCRFTEFYKTELEDTEFYLKYCSVHKFIDRMDLAYNAADIVISRAGAIVISEICFLSKASILIPSPYVTANHQEINAEYLGINNACIVLSENSFNLNRIAKSNIFSNVDETTSRKLIVVINTLKNKDKREQMGKNANKLFKYNTAEEISSVILSDIKLV